VSLHREDLVSSTTRRKMDAAIAMVLSTFQFGNKEIQDRDDDDDDDRRITFNVAHSPKISRTRNS